MKNYIYIIIFFFIISNAVSAENKKHSVIPPHGFVPNEITAIKIAEAIWLPIYGKNIYSKKPSFHPLGLFKEELFFSLTPPYANCYG